MILPVVAVLATVQSVTGDSAQAIAARVEIVRTEYGVPHILAEDLKAMGFALAWVQCEDYSASIAFGFARSRGDLALHLGPEELDSDFRMRDSHDLAARSYRLLDRRAREVYQGFALGLNHYIDSHRHEFPAWIEPDFTGVEALARDAQSWSRGDAARFVAYMESESGRSSTGSRDASVPARSLSSPSGGRRPIDPGDAIDGSNAWALAPSRTAAGNAILLRNPHLGWGRPEELLERPSGLTYYEAHVRVPGVVDFYGDFRIGGAFGIIGGFNSRLGWATTNNYPTLSQVYALELHPELPNHVVLDGRPEPLEERVRRVPYLSESGQTEAEFRSTWWSAHGPVIHRDDSRVYVLKDPRDGLFRRGEQFLRMMMADDLEAWLRVMRTRAHPSSNFTYADADGNIVHLYNANLPELPHSVTGDSAAPARTTGDIWSRLVSWDRLPLHVNPPGGYLQQANDTPEFSNLETRHDRDTLPANLPEPRLRLRSQLSLDLIGGPEKLSLQEVVSLKHSPRMLLAERALDDLLALARVEDDAGLAEAVRVLESWDRTAAADSRGGVLFKRWAELYFFSNQFEEEEGWEEPWNEALPISTPRGLRDGERALLALREAGDLLAEEGVALDAPWGQVHRVARGEVDAPVSGCEPFLGCFRTLSFERTGPGRYAANRGDSWVFAVEFGETPRAFTVLSYGQTARSGSVHFDDQAELFARGRMKPIAWSDGEIRAKEIARYRPTAG